MTSPSTLIRKAASAKSPREAKKLRAQAAKLRREIRALKTSSGKPANNRPIARRPRTLRQIATSPVTERVVMGSHDNVGGWAARDVTEIIEQDQIERLRKHARNRKHKDSFDIGVRSAVMTGVSRGRTEVAEQTREKLRAVYDANRIAVVSGFISEMNAVAKATGGPLPPTTIVSGYTLARVLEALREAGYTESGKEGGRRG